MYMRHNLGSTFLKKRPRLADKSIVRRGGAGLLFKKGEVVRQVPEQDLLRALLTEVAALTGEAVELPE
jgi:hypothetical protein